jgi:hypothetical protein
MCAGTYVPAIKGKPSGTGGGSPVAPVRKTGEDFVRVYIDADIDPATGYSVSISSKVIGAEYMIEVVGQFGEVVSESLYAYDGTWAEVSGVSIDAENDLQRIEIGVLASALGGDSAIDFIIETTDWKERTDVAASDEFLMSAVSGGLLSDTRSWVVDSSNSKYATASSCQRQMFYDGTNFWSLYWDGSNTQCRYSEDGGETWNNGNRAFSTSGMNKTSLWYDAANNTVYIIGDNSDSTRNVTVRKGTVSPSTPSISWSAEVRHPISSSPMSNKNAFICRDSSGYIWLLANSNISSSPSNLKYNLRTANTTSPNDISEWVDRGNLLGGSFVGTGANGVLVPGKSSSSYIVWAVYTYDGDVASKTFTTGWTSGETMLYAAGGSADNTKYAPPSAVIDANGVVHVAYGTGDTDAGPWKGQIQYRYCSESDWSPVWTLDDATTYGTKSPTVSLDSSTGNVYAMWLNSNNEVLIQKNVSGDWTSITLDQTSYAKNYLTSIYNASGESLICFQWTQNTTTSDIEVIFDKIPEFTDTFIPVLFILTLFAVYRSRARRMGSGKDCDEAGDDGL